MDYIKDLESGSSPKIRKAAKTIIKNNLTKYCPFLLEALIKEMDKPKAWKTQCQLIKAIGLSKCYKTIDILKKLIDKDYKSTILYRELAFSIFILENTTELNLSFLYLSIEKGNELQISGACAAILYKEIIPEKDDIERIITGISSYTEDEGRKITPRCYIAAVAYLWPKDAVQDFLESCLHSTSSTLVEIAYSSLKREKTKILI